MTEVMSDEGLLFRMGRRDEAALVELHRRYAPYLTAVARRMLRDPDEVQQCVEDAFVKAWDHAGNFDPKRASAKTWLVTICHRLAINRLRGTTLETVPLESWDAPTYDPDPIDRLEIERALSQLEPQERELIELAFYQGFSHTQVAEKTGKPLGTTKTRLRGALTKLREHLKGGE